MRAPRILISTQTTEFGGIEGHLYHLSKVLMHAGAHVTIAAQAFELYRPWREELAGLGVEILTTPFSFHTKLLPVRHAYSLGKFFLKLRRDHDLLMNLGHGGFHRLLKPLLKPTGFSIYNFAGAAVGLTPGVLRAMRAMDAVMPLTHVVTHTLWHEWGIHKPMRPLAHLSGELQIPDVPNVRRQHDADSEVRIVFLGRLNWFKRPDLLVRIWPTLNIGRARLDLYGDGEYREGLARSIQELGLGDRITLHGKYEQAEAMNILAKADLMVLPSQSEGLGLVLLEAMAAGVPFVATKVGGIPELAEGNPNVLLTGTEDAAVAQGIEAMVARIRNNTISAHALQEYYRTRYSYGVLVEQWKHAMFDPVDFFGPTSPRSQAPG